MLENIFKTFGNQKPHVLIMQDGGFHRLDNSDLKEIINVLALVNLNNNLWNQDEIDRNKIQELEIALGALLSNED